MLDPDFVSTASSGYAWDCTFAGYLRVEGLYNVRHRWLHPNLAAWLQRDPIRDGSSLYEYARSAPLNATDPSGMWISIAAGCAACFAGLARSYGIPAITCQSFAARYQNDPLGFVVNGRRLYGDDAVAAAYLDCMQEYAGLQGDTGAAIDKILLVGGCSFCMGASLVKVLPAATKVVLPVVAIPGITAASGSALALGTVTWLAPTAPAIMVCAAATGAEFYPVHCCCYTGGKIYYYHIPAVLCLGMFASRFRDTCQIVAHNAMCGYGVRRF